MTRVDIIITCTIEKMLELRRETLTSHDDLQKRLTCKEGEAAKDAGAREKSKVERCGAKVRLEMMEDSKKWSTDADQRTATALLQVAEAKGELSKSTEK